MMTVSHASIENCCLRDTNFDINQYKDMVENNMGAKLKENDQKSCDYATKTYHTCKTNIFGLTMLDKSRNYLPGDYNTLASNLKLISHEKLNWNFMTNSAEFSNAMTYLMYAPLLDHTIFYSLPLYRTGNVENDLTKDVESVLTRCKEKFAFTCLEVYVAMCTNYKAKNIYWVNEDATKSNDVISLITSKKITNFPSKNFCEDFKSGVNKISMTNTKMETLMVVMEAVKGSKDYKAMFDKLKDVDVYGMIDFVEESDKPVDVIPVVTNDVPKKRNKNILSSLINAIIKKWK